VAQGIEMVFMQLHGVDKIQPLLVAEFAHNVSVNFGVFE
jgi:hypothetical protein